MTPQDAYFCLYWGGIFLVILSLAGLVDYIIRRGNRKSKEGRI